MRPSECQAIALPVPPLRVSVITYSPLVACAATQGQIITYYLYNYILLIITYYLSDITTINFGNVLRPY